MRSFLVLTIVAAMAGAANTLVAQNRTERFDRQLEQDQRSSSLVNDLLSAGERSFFDYGGYLSVDYLSLDDPFGQNHVRRSYELIGYGRLNIDDVHEFFLRTRFRFEEFHVGDSFDGDDEETEFQIDQAFYRFDSLRFNTAYRGRTLEEGFVLQAGRQFVYWGNGLTLNQDVDGLAVQLQSRQWQVDLLAGVSVPETVDFDLSRPDFDDDTRRGFFGAMLTATGTPRHRPYVYVLVQRDHNDDGPVNIGGYNTAFEYNSYYLGIGARGSLTDRLVYSLEGAWEGGNALSNSFNQAAGGSPPPPVEPQTYERIEAWGLDARLDYLLADAHRSRLTGEAIVTSGDPDRLQTSNTFGGNLTDTTDRAFNAFGLLNTGLAFSPAASNLTALRLGASTFPGRGVHALERLQLGIDVFYYAKTDADAPIEEPTADGHFLGWELDLFLNWQVSSDVSLAARYGIFFPSERILSDQDPRHLFFIGMTFAF